MNIKMNTEQWIELDGMMHDIYTDNDLPDGAWFAILEELAAAYIKSRGVHADNNTLVHDYLTWKNARGSKQA